MGLPTGGKPPKGASSGSGKPFKPSTNPVPNWNYNPTPAPGKGKITKQSRYDRRRAKSNSKTPPPEPVRTVTRQLSRRERLQFNRSGGRSGGTPRTFSPPPPIPEPPPNSPPPPSSSPGVAGLGLRTAGSIAKSPSPAALTVAAGILIASVALSLWQNRNKSKTEIAGIYPGSSSVISLTPRNFSGGQMPGVTYNVYAVATVLHPTNGSVLGSNNAAVINNVIGSITDITFRWIPTSNPGAPGALNAWMSVTGANGVKIYQGIANFTPSLIADLQILVTRVGNLPDTGGDPPPIVLNSSSGNIDLSTSGTTTSDGKVWYGNAPSVLEAGSPSSVDAPGGTERKANVPPPTISDYKFPPPPVVNLPGGGTSTDTQEGTYPGGGKPATTTTASDGKFLASGNPNLGDIGGDTTWFNTDGTTQKGGVKPHTQSSLSTNNTYTPAPTNTPAPVNKPGTSPSGNLQTDPDIDPTKPGSNNTKPGTTTTPTPPAEDKIDLTPLLPLIALAPGINSKLDKIDDTTTQIKNEPKSPCLAPVYVPPVDAKVTQNIAATDALHAYTATQTTAIKADTTIINTQVAEVNTKASTIQTTTSTVLTKVGEVGTSITKLWSLIGVDRWINYVNMALLFHNALMLSNNLGQTAISAIENVFQLFGLKIQDDKGNEINLSTLVGHTAENVAKAALGADNYTAMVTSWKKANIIYQTGMNVLYGVQSIGNSLQSLTQLAIENTGKIGNALRKAGTVLENAYAPMAERVTAMTPFQQKLQNFTGTVQGAEDAISNLDSVTSEVTSMNDARKELFGDGTANNKGQIKEFEDSVKTISDTKKAEEEAKKTASQSPDIPKTALIKPEEATPPPSPAP